MCISRVAVVAPFAHDGAETAARTRNLYKNVTGDKLIFEEVNLELGLTYRYAWRTSERYGFVRTVWLQNNVEQPCTVKLLPEMPRPNSSPPTSIV